MSGKPASVGASRAGGPGAPRVLVYVADQRQLEPGAAGPDPPPAAGAPPSQPPPPPPLDAPYLPDHLHHQVNVPRNTIYRSHIDRNEQRNLSNTFFYKPLIDSDGKLGTFGPSDKIGQRTEFYSVPQPCPKETNLKIDDVRNNRHSNLTVRQDCADQVGTEFNGIESFHTRVPVETVDLASYQARCSGPVNSDNTMTSMQSVALHHGQNQYSENITVHSVGDGSNSGERELSVGKSFVNYQFLEQSVSHQSIVNQSISILNQQVGVSRGVASEGESGSAPQLVRTADGVVLAVLPAGTGILPHPPDNPELSSRTVQSEPPQTITVPLGWKRIVSGTSVLYISPSGTALSTFPQLRDYLQTAGTCKCGLPCPLRPETTFSFDSKVVSKPYQPSSGAELTKLCNHKRKLLATLQARAQSPATPPPQNNEQTLVVGNEVAVLKKKMKKRPGFPANVGVSQLMVQRERPLNEFKDTDSARDTPPGMGSQRSNIGPSCLPTYPNVQQNTLNTMSQDTEIKQETLVQRSSHYLTVSSGWISQHSQHSENLEAGQKQGQTTPGAVSTPHSAGMPVLGTNGQIIGVNTGFNKQTNHYKNASGSSQNSSEYVQKEDRKDMAAAQANIQGVRYPYKEEESQIYCGLNQPLTPEVMQKINEQQQIFIQQNQKQIEMAMKGYRTQLSENVNQIKAQGQSQYVPQAQLVIQNGAVVKTNPAKTPPWQVKRNESSASNPMTSPSPKLHKLENIDYEESNASISEDSSGSYSSFSSSEQVNNQGMCSRVPPLPQHYNMMGQQWPVVDTNKKKIKTHTKSAKKKNSPTDNKLHTFGGNGMRLVQDSKGMGDDAPSNNVPSFMDDPNGYLAQQTVLLNNTISKQVGINSSYDNSPYEGSSTANCCVAQNQMDKMKAMSKPSELSHPYRSNVPNHSLSPTSTPDSSVLSEKGIDNCMSQCCKGCNLSMKSCSPDFSDNQLRIKYMKHQMYKMEMESNASTSSPKHGFDDNPVISSTFIERNPMVNDNCGPIQAATVSTSNVSITETLQPPEPSPTLSNSSRSTDTPHSSGSSNSQMLSNCTYPISSPAYSNSGPYRDNYGSNPSTPGGNLMYPYNSPGPPNNQSITGPQVMHFISNHNVNKNLMEVDNISMVGVRPGVKNPQDIFRLEQRRRMENSMPGYCPPPHMGGGPAHSLIQACYVQTFVTTMASGFSVTRDTVTSVLAGKANTATTSINASHVNFIRPPPPPSVNLATTYAIPNNQPDPFINSVNLPTSYPLHIAGTTAQNMISKSPLEMVQNVIGSLPSKPETSSGQGNSLAHLNRRTCTTPGQILISSTGQIIVSNNQMPPPPPKTTTTIASLQGNATNVTTSVNQAVPAVGGMQPMVNQPTVVVNALPPPFVIQPPMMAVDGQVMQQHQNTVMPQIVTGGIVSGQSPSESSRQIDVKNHQNFVQGVAMLSPESMKKRNKKKKSPANITNVLQIAAPQQNSNNIMVHHSSPQHSTSPQFSPRGFQLSPNNNISPTPMLQALTIVPGKSGTPAHIVMNGQGNTNNFGSQQIIANTSPSQQINLLQPVNLINNASGVVPNFPAFQQFIVPSLGGVVMTADGTAIIQDNSTGMPVQLQLQTVNGQNVLTPVQNSGVFAAGANGGVVIRAQNQPGKIIQSQHSPGAQFLSPNSQVMMSSPNFNGQLSPLLANLSPTNVTFGAGPQVRSGNVQTQEYIQTNQMGQALMVPLSPKRVPIASATTNRSNSTFVHQNTTIVQQQTTLVSNSHNAQLSSLTTNLQGGNASRLSIDPNVLLGGKRIANQKGRYSESPPGKFRGSEVRADGYGELSAAAEHARHSVSTQTLMNAARGKSPAAAGGPGAGRSPPGAACSPPGAGCSPAGAGCSPPDTTTHSPLGARDAEPPPAGPRPSAPRKLSAPDLADTTTDELESADAASSAMVQCVSSSEQDMAESREQPWATPRNDFNSDTDTQSMISNIPLMRQSRSHNPVESTDLHYNQNLNTSSVGNQHVMPMTSNYYERTHTYKRKNDFGDGSTYRPDKIMRMNNYNMVHGLPKESDYGAIGIHSPDKVQSRHYPPSGTSSDMSAMPKVFERHNLGTGDDVGEQTDERARAARGFAPGDLVWGPAKGYAMWPGKLQARRADGRWAVRWFGAERSLAALHPARLLGLSDGLEAHHAARTRQRKSRKLNTLLENAIQEAMAELDKKSEGAGAGAGAGGECAAAPRRARKHDRAGTSDRHHKNKSPIKIAPNPTKSGDGARLRSSR